MRGTAPLFTLYTFMTCLWTTSTVVSTRRAQISESWLGFAHSVAYFLGRFELLSYWFSICTGTEEGEVASDVADK
jgi:hypothetical protein